MVVGGVYWYCVCVHIQKYLMIGYRCCTVGLWEKEGGLLSDLKRDSTSAKVFTGLRSENLLYRKQVDSSIAVAILQFFWSTVTNTQAIPLIKYMSS